jgi:hypothetical protein
MVGRLMIKPKPELYHIAIDRLEVALISVLVSQSLDQDDVKSPQVLKSLLNLKKVTSEVTVDLH